MVRLLMLVALLLALAAPALGQADPTIAGNITTTSCPGSGCLSLTNLSSKSVATVEVSGTWSGTLLVEITNSWSSVSVYQASTKASAASITANGVYQVPMQGASSVRVRASVFSSGTAAVRLSAGSGDASFATSGTVTANAGTGTFAVSAAALPLPSGAATGAKQDTGNASLSSIDGKTPALGQALAAASVPVVLTAAQLSTLTPLTTVAVTGTFWQATQPISAAALPLPSGASTEATLSSLNGKVTAVDTGAVVVASSALPSGAATSAAQTTGNSSLSSIDTKTPALGQATMANSQPVAIASNQSAVPVSGTVTANAGSGTMAVSSSQLPAALAAGGGLKVEGVAGGVAVQVSGTFFQATQPVSAAALPLPSGASTLAEQQTQTTALQIIDDLPIAQGAAVAGKTGPMNQAVAKSSNPSYSDSTVNPLSLYLNGDLRVHDDTNAGTLGQIYDVLNATQALPNGGPNNGGMTVVGGLDASGFGRQFLFTNTTPGASDYAPVVRTLPAQTDVSQKATGITASGGAWFIKLTDGTNVQAVKAASTAAAAADPSSVVALSPNSPLPTGSNTIGALTANQSVNNAQIAGAATATGLGIGDTGTQRVTLSSELTYSASTTAMTATAAGTGVFANICGSASKTVRIQRIRVSGTVATGAKYGDVIIKKTSAATTSGTATTLTNVPYDSSSAAATAVAKFYTVLGTAGTPVGAVDSVIMFLPITGTPAATGTPIEFTWRDNDSEAPTLRGTAQCLELNFGTTTSTAPTLTFAVKWTEK